jgi:hypothetical protein
VSSLEASWSIAFRFDGRCTRVRKAIAPIAAAAQALRNLGLTEMRRLWWLAAIDPLFPETAQCLLNLPIGGAARRENPWSEHPLFLKTHCAIIRYASQRSVTAMPLRLTI